MQLLHKQIGDTVQATGPDGTPHTFRIVGRMVAPSVRDVLTNSLGDGAWIDASFVHQEWQSPSNPQLALRRSAMPSQRPSVNGDASWGSRDSPDDRFLRRAPSVADWPWHHGRAQGAPRQPSRQ